MASGTKHFLYNQREDWLRQGWMEGLTLREDGLVLAGDGRGSYTSMALDTTTPETVWHRLRLVSHVPANAQLRLYLYCSDESGVPPPFRPEGQEDTGLDDWLASAPAPRREEFFRVCAQQVYDDPTDLTLYGCKGRCLWFCLTFANYDREEMRLESIRLEFPRIAFIDYLPQVYRGADSVNSFLARFISVFQSPYVDLEDDMDQMPVRCDPAVAPLEFLQWLAESLAVSDRHLWSEERLRVFLKNAVRLYRIKGTRAALREVIELYTGQTPWIIEQFEPASCQIWRRDTAALRRLYGESRYTVTVLMPGAQRDADDYAKLWKIIAAFKPVDAICNLVFVNDEIILGQHCYLGMNSRIGRSRGLVLDGTSVPSAPYRQFFDARRFGAPYAAPEEYLLDLVRWCELLLSAYLPCYASQIPWEGALEGAADPGAVRQSVLQDFDKALFHIDARARTSVEAGGFLAGQYVREVWKLTNLELLALMLWLLPAYDERFGPLLGQLQGNPALRRPSFDLTLKLFHFVDRAEDVPQYHVQRRALEEKADFAFLQRDGTLDTRTAEFLLQNGASRLDSGVGQVCLPDAGGPLPLREREAEELAAAIAADGRERETLFVCLRGGKGAGRATQVRRVSELLEVPAVFFDCAQAAFSRREDFFAALRTAGRETVLLQGMLALRSFERLLEEPETAQQALELAGRYSGVVFVLAEPEAVTVELAARRRWIEVEVPLPTKGESIALWQRALEALPLSEGVEGAEMANKFAFTPAQIAGTGRTAAGMALLQGPLDRRQVTAAAYRQISHKLAEHATLIYARHTWDQLVLGEAEKEMLRMACDQVRYQHVVYDQWGFNQRLAYGKGVSMLFAGPPGTGKTMAAQVVANELGIEMYKVDLSQVVSKYIGETEKNLNQVFNEAKKSNVILFFDETDAILGKRTEVKDAHDKNANLETAYLLQKMEEYDGITVMTTNYKENIDSAFFRRISYVIHFTFPDARARREIWRGIFPADTPLGEVDFEYLANQFEITGGSIKNIALVASFMAARNGEAVDMGHIVKAVKYEMAKQGKIMLREDYGEYGYLLK